MDILPITKIDGSLPTKQNRWISFRPQTQALSLIPFRVKNVDGSPSDRKQQALSIDPLPTKNGIDPLETENNWYLGFKWCGVRVVLKSLAVVLKCLAELDVIVCLLAVMLQFQL